MSRGLKQGDIYLDEANEPQRAAIILSVDADGTRARLEFLDGNGDFTATQDQLVSWTLIGSCAFQGDPAPWRITKTRYDGVLRWKSFAADEEHARAILEQARRDTGTRIEIAPD